MGIDFLMVIMASGIARGRVRKLVEISNVNDAIYVCEYVYVCIPVDLDITTYQSGNNLTHHINQFRSP